MPADPGMGETEVAHDLSLPVRLHGALFQVGRTQAHTRMRGRWRLKRTCQTSDSLGQLSVTTAVFHSSTISIYNQLNVKRKKRFNAIFTEKEALSGRQQALSGSRAALETGFTSWLYSPPGLKPGGAQEPVPAPTGRGQP